MELPEGELLGAETFRLEMADDGLVFPAGRIDRQSPEHPHGQPVGRIEGQPLGVALPHHGPERRGAVAEAEIQVTRLGPGQVRDLAMDGNHVEVGLERPLMRSVSAETDRNSEPNGSREAVKSGSPAMGEGRRVASRRRRKLSVRGGSLI